MAAAIGRYRAQLARLVVDDALAVWRPRRRRDVTPERQPGWQVPLDVRRATACPSAPPMRVSRELPFGEGLDAQEQPSLREVRGLNSPRRSTDTSADCCDVSPPGRYTSVPVSLNVRVLDATVVARMHDALNHGYGLARNFQPVHVERHRQQRVTTGVDDVASGQILGADATSDDGFRHSTRQRLAPRIEASSNVAMSWVPIVNITERPSGSRAGKRCVFSRRSGSGTVTAGGDLAVGRNAKQPRVQPCGKHNRVVRAPCLFFAPRTSGTSVMRDGTPPRSLDSHQPAIGKESEPLAIRREERSACRLAAFDGHALE